MPEKEKTMVELPRLKFDIETNVNNTHFIARWKNIGKPPFYVNLSTVESTIDLLMVVRSEDKNVLCYQDFTDSYKTLNCSQFSFEYLLRNWFKEMNISEDTWIPLAISTFVERPIKVANAPISVELA